MLAQHGVWVMAIPQSHSGSFNIPVASSSPEYCFVFCRACADQTEMSKGRCSGFNFISENFNAKYVLKLQPHKHMRGFQSPIIQAERMGDLELCSAPSWQKLHCLPATSPLCHACVPHTKLFHTG